MLNFRGCNHLSKPTATYPPKKTNISHLGKRKIIFKHTLGEDILVPRTASTKLPYICICLIPPKMANVAGPFTYPIPIPPSHGAAKGTPPPPPRPPSWRRHDDILSMTKRALENELKATGCLDPAGGF